VKDIIISILNSEYKTVVCVGDEKVVEQTLKRWGYEDIGDIKWGARRGLTFSNSSCHPVIALPNIPKTEEELGTLAHEAVHAIEAIFHHIGERSTGEVFAHSVGAIVRETLQKCNQSTKKPRSSSMKTTRGKK
jgi:hypothetical protein